MNVLIRLLFYHTDTYVLLCVLCVALIYGISEHVIVRIFFVNDL